MVPLSGGSGLTIFFTGLSGAGKTTLAEALQTKLGEIDARPVRLFDGDVLRRSLSPELGFSREHRDLHVVRVGHVAAEITACGAIAICAVIAPYEKARKTVRAMIEAVGTFVLVHVSTPLEVCEQRDSKGLYAKARAGQLTQFTGISDPYEVPRDADLAIDTTHISAEDAARRLIHELTDRGCLSGKDQGDRAIYN
jgi:sulfate adenylyltransferase